MRYYLIAGEASGDLHGSNLMKGLQAEDPTAEFRFWGGGMMEAVGGTKVRDYKATAVMGATDVLRSLGKISRNLRDCKADILSWKPDVVILIDYPGFNMKIARFCHENGIRVFYYIAPKTWASREGRNRKLKAWVDRLFIVFPFEIPYFESRQIPFIYKGNPLVDAVDNHSYERPVEGKYIAILAGSRKGEISHTMPNAMQMADTLRALPEYADYQFIVAGAPARSEEDYAKYIAGRPFVKVLFGRTYDVLKFADAALINSGTASLEAALIGTPQVVCWSTSFITAFLAKYALRVLDHIKYISLGNLILDKLAFRELIQYDYTPTAAGEEIRRLIEDLPYRNRMQEDYAEIRARLGGTGASREVAKAMIEALNQL
ncbi:MAG: lipid-A-disaccharide synthase [Bacteroidales bacterium]|nr:lipid-A-disaccharide synthase [Bacteroidales bacterium]